MHAAAVLRSTVVVHHGQTSYHGVFITPHHRPLREEEVEEEVVEEGRSRGSRKQWKCGKKVEEVEEEVEEGGGSLHGVEKKVEVTWCVEKRS